MYEGFYGFGEKPFSLSPDPQFLYLSQKHRRALMLLSYGLENQAGFTVITGEIGSGKTTLIRALLNQIGEDIKAGLVSNPHCESFQELLRWILLSFGEDYQKQDKVELYEEFTKFLLREHADKRRAVLIVDEAQHLTAGTLEQLRLLSNVSADSTQLLQLILVGQPELRQTLLCPELKQFVQRIVVDYHLNPLDKEETEHYIRHRLMTVGGNSRTFDDDTFDLIWRSTGGVPRLINILCDTALVYGFADQRETIGINVICDVIRDRQSEISPFILQPPCTGGSDPDANQTMTSEKGSAESSNDDGALLLPKKKERRARDRRSVISDSNSDGTKNERRGRERRSAYEEPQADGEYPV